LLVGVASATWPGSWAAGLARQRVHQHPAGPPQPDGAEFLQVSRQGRLGDMDPAVTEQPGEFLLRPHLVVIQDGGDLRVAGGLGDRAHGRHRARSSSQRDVTGCAGPV